MVIYLNIPVYMIPFVYIYKFLGFIFRSVFKFFKYFNVGLFFIIYIFAYIVVNFMVLVLKGFIFTFICLSYLFFNLLKRCLKGFVCLSYLFLKLLRYCLKGFIWIKDLIYDIIKHLGYGFVVFSCLVYNFVKHVGYGFVVFSCLVYNFVKYVGYGFVVFSCLVYNFVEHIGYGFTVFSYLVYRLIRYIGMGFAFPFVLTKNKIFNFIENARLVSEKRKFEEEQRRLTEEYNKKIQEENQKRLDEARQKELEEEAKKRLEIINENAIVDASQQTDGENGEAVEEIKQNKFKAIILSIKNLFSKNKDINRQALLLDFEGADAERSTEKVMYKYVAKNIDGKIVTGYFPAYSKVEVHSFLLSEGSEVYSIKTNGLIKLIYGNGASLNRKKIKTKDLIFFTTQLSTYLKAGITLVEGLKILSRQFKNKTYSRIFRSLIYDLSMGDSFSQAMDKQGDAFPRLFINMVKASEMTGELPEVLDDMEEYFTEIDKTRKQMITAMTYPTIIFVLSIVAVAFIMIYVVPKFVGIYNDIDGAQIPGITIFVMNMSNFLQNNYLILLAIIVVFIIVFICLYKNIKSFKAGVQWFLMHVPVIGNVIIYNEVTMFTKTFASLLAHNVFITDSMDILKKLTNNEVYKSLIFDTIDNLAKGEKISLAFENHWAFPMPAYEMIKTGEMTGQLPEMMLKVSNYYQELHKNSVTRIKTFVEPALILFLTFVVGGIVLSIVIPMFSVYNAIQV